jgi:phage tail sheath protein FI
MATKLKTPGVYIEEKNAFPGSVVEVETAIPAFIGYTEGASRNGKSLLNKPTRITSFAEYILLFGGQFNPKFTLDAAEEGSTWKHLISINGTKREIKFKKDHDAFMFRCIQLFFKNGGGTCYIVSVGTYGNTDEVTVVKNELLGGISTLLKEQEPTMVLVPDAVKLGDDCYEVYKQVLEHCNKMQSRMGIFDVYNGYEDRIQDSDIEIDVIGRFREKIGTKYLKFGAAYFPWLETSIVPKGELTFKCLDEGIILSDILPEKDAQLLISNFSNQPVSPNEEEGDGEVGEVSGGNSENDNRNYHLGLLATSPTYVNILDEVRGVMNLLPPSAALAGVYTSVDNDRGVWKAPANISLNEVVKPSSNITHDEQENLNVDAISGKSINAIRTFPGIGTLVWGGRTLDGNSLDWRYINVRRTMIMLEQSIKLALRAYVFEPNEANTWVTVKSMIVNFLTEKWKQGALAGSSPEDAFDVQIGLGNTMTSLDILEGKMLISVKLAIVRPAEFIVVTFQQQMQKS